MERIVIEVDDHLAEAWRNASEKTKNEIENKINISLAKVFKNDIVGDYLKFLEELRADMKQKGLTEEELNDILNDA